MKPLLFLSLIFFCYNLYPSQDESILCVRTSKIRQTVEVTQRNNHASVMITNTKLVNYILNAIKLNDPQSRTAVNSILTCTQSGWIIAKPSLQTGQNCIFYGTTEEPVQPYPLLEILWNQLSGAAQKSKLKSIIADIIHARAVGKIKLVRSNFNPQILTKKFHIYPDNYSNYHIKLNISYNSAQITDAPELTFEDQDLQDLKKNIQSSNIDTRIDESGESNQRRVAKFFGKRDTLFTVLICAYSAQDGQLHTFLSE